MGVYARHILPWATDRVCGARPTHRQREKVIPLASGTVLEIGAGSGLNFPLYKADRVERVVALDPSEGMLRRARAVADRAAVDVELLRAVAEDIPLESASVDTVVMTYTLCTIPEPVKALREMARVLAPDGRLVFCEHGLAPDPWIRRWQRWLDPAWGLVAGGCSLGRDIPGLIAGGGFRITGLESMYIPGWRPGSFNYWGSATAG